MCTRIKLILSDCSLTGLLYFYTAYNNEPSQKARSVEGARVRVSLVLAPACIFAQCSQNHLGSTTALACGSVRSFMCSVWQLASAKTHTIYGKFGSLPAGGSIPSRINFSQQSSSLCTRPNPPHPDGLIAALLVRSQVWLQSLNETHQTGKKCIMDWLNCRVYQSTYVTTAIMHIEPDARHWLIDCIRVIPVWIKTIEGHKRE